MSNPQSVVVTEGQSKIWFESSKEGDKYALEVVRDNFRLFSGEDVIALTKELNAREGDLAARRKENVRLVEAARYAIRAVAFAKQRFDEMGMDWLGNERDPLELATEKLNAAIFDKGDNQVKP